MKREIRRKQAKKAATAESSQTKKALFTASLFCSASVAYAQDTLLQELIENATNGEFSWDPDHDDYHQHLHIRTPHHMHHDPADIGTAHSTVPHHSYTHKGEYLDDGRSHANFKD